MNFINRTLVRLADESMRVALFDEAALEQLLACAYDTASTPVNAPFSPIFDHLDVGYGTVHQSHGKAKLFGNGGGATDALIQFSDWSPSAAAQTDALWQGAISARSAPDDSVIEAVSAAWANLGAIDPAIAADNGGALPADPEALENGRRAQLIALLQDGLNSPQAVDGAAIDTLLEAVGVATVGELIQAGTSAPGTLRVQFSAASAAPPSVQVFPIRAALLIQDEGFSLRDLLRESKLLRSRLQDDCPDSPHAAPLPPRRTFLVAWIVPASVFDDDDWPGDTQGMNPTQARAVRRSQAGVWLAREGIGLIVVEDG